MDQRIVPTSPKKRSHTSKQGSEHNRRSHPHLLFIVTLIALLFGTVSGLLGFAIASSVPEDWPLIGKLNVVNSFEKERQNILLSTRSGESSVVSQVPQVVNQVVSVYNTAPTISEPGIFLGDAVVITADGWMVMPTAIFPPEAEREQAAVIIPDGSTKHIVQYSKDSFSGLTFFRVEAQNLSVVNFGESLPLRAGDTVSLLVKQLQQFMVYERRVVGDSDISNAVRSTTDVHQVAIVDTDSRIQSAGAPAFYSNGTLAGIIIDGIIVHSSVIQSALPALTTSNEIIRSALDVQYMQLEQVTDEEKQLQSLPDAGLYIVAAPENGILKTGDTIISINSHFINGEDDLSTIIHSRPVETVFYMTVVRDGEEVAIELKS